jgi:hypothetical protein
MSTMTQTPMPGTPAALLVALQSPDALGNTPIGTALKYQDFLTELGVPFESLHVNGVGDTTYSLAQVQVMPVDQSMPIGIHGTWQGKAVNIAKERMATAGLGGIALIDKILSLRGDVAGAGAQHAVKLFGPVIDASINAVKAKYGV